MNADLREQVAQLARDSAPAVTQARQAALEAQRQTAELKQTFDELQANRSAIDQFAADLGRMRDEAALLEADRLITLAATELQVVGHVPTALAALVSADARLAQTERPQTVALRRALARDIERLRAVPVVDFTGLALKLDQLIQGVDTWPMLADPAPRKSAAPAKAAPKQPAAPADTWEQVRGWITREFGDLIRIREVEAPASVLLSGAQQQLVRERLKLRLLTARQALLARNERLFRSDLAESQAAMTRYFDTRVAATAAALAQLRQIAQAPLTVELPASMESVAAVRALRVAPTKK